MVWSYPLLSLPICRGIYRPYLFILLFYKKIAWQLKHSQNLDIFLPITSILGNIEVWYMNTTSISHVPPFLLWNIWITHNITLFEGKNNGTEHTCVRILDQLISFPLIKNIKRSRLIGPPPTLLYPHGYFDGASKNNLGGASIMLEISNIHSFSLKLGCDFSTNSRVELLALWKLLLFAAEMGIFPIYFW